MSKMPMDRRTFLKGTGVFVGLPFLEAMLPRFAWSAVPGSPRLVAVYGGVPTFFQQRDLAIGALPSALPRALTALNGVRQHVSVLTNMRLPQYSGTQTPEPGSVLAQQHYTAPAPSLAGVSTIDNKPMITNCHTIDQVFADVYGTASRFKSIQACVQAVPYNGKSSTTAPGGQISSRYVNGVHNVLPPIVSPLDLWNKLFSGFTAPTSPTSPSSLALADKSVLDLVLDDANRLQASVSGGDKIRLEQYFDEIRTIERSLASTTPGTGGSGSCTAPTKPGADVAASTFAFGGWAAETLRRDQQADILALAIACDLTRAVSWQLTYDQCFMGAQNISGVTAYDIHEISHQVGNDTTGKLKIAMEDQYNWHCAGFARLVEKLASLPEGSGNVLDSTFVGMCNGEGTSAHNRTIMHVLIAGCKNEMKLGQHIAGASEHTARVWISAMNALGINKTKLGEVSGMMASILK